MPDNIKRAESTQEIFSENALLKAYKNLAGDKVRESTVQNFLNTIRSLDPSVRINQSGSFGHYLIKGTRGESFPVQGMYMSDFVPTNGLTVEDLARKLNITAGKITTRQHYGQATPGFTLGQKQGGIIPQNKTK